jgi:hypothetical protein
LPGRDKKTTGATTPIVASTAKLRSRWRNANCRFRAASAMVYRIANDQRRGQELESDGVEPR